MFGGFFCTCLCTYVVFILCSQTWSFDDVFTHLFITLWWWGTLTLTLWQQCTVTHQDSPQKVSLSICQDWFLCLVDFTLSHCTGETHWHTRTGWRGGSIGRVLDSDPKDEGSNPVRSTRNMCEFSRVKNVVQTRFRCAQPPCVHARTRMITYAR